MIAVLALIVLLIVIIGAVAYLAAPELKADPYQARHDRTKPTPGPPVLPAPGWLPMLPEEPPWPQDDTWWNTPAAASELLAALKEPVPADTRADLPAVSLTARYLP